MGPFHGMPFNMSLFVHFLPISFYDKLLSIMVLNPSSFGIDIPKKTENIGTDVVRCKPPMIDIGALDLIKKKIVKVIVGEIVKVEGRDVYFSDGSHKEFDAIVKATGYLSTAGCEPLFRARLQKEIGDISSEEARTDGVKKCIYEIEHALPQSNREAGLYFSGYRDHISRLREMGIEAGEIANDIQQQR